MNCNSNVNEQFRKSVLVSVDDVEQIYDNVNEESPLLLGQVVYQSGTALELSESYHRIKRKGLYRADASVVFIPKDDGIITVRMLLSGCMLPSSKTRLTVEKNKYYTITSCVPAFDRIFSLELTPKLELTIAGVPGIVVRTMLSTTKLA
jgi:hypothetical protein